jgi:hypothetical protein
VSVHGEYHRSLESLIARVRRIDRPEREVWLARLEGARPDRHADLSAAARAGLAALEQLAADLGWKWSDDASSTEAGLREPYTHLLAHCRIVLGLPSEDGD